MEEEMDNNYNQQTNGNPYQQKQGNPYQQQGNPYQQQGNPYQQQGNPYQQQGNPYQQQGNPYQQQGNFYQQGYQQGTPYMGNGYGNNGGANTEPQKAPNIFQQFVLAFVPTKYDRLTKVKTGSMIGFVTLLVLIATLLSFIILAVDFASIDMDEMAEELPDFEITGGHLYMEEDFLYDEDIIFVYMTDDIDEFSYEDAADLLYEGYQDILLVGRDSISVMQNGQYSQADYSEFGGLEISRDWLVSTMMPFLMGVIGVAYIIIFLGMGLGYFLLAAVYLLFAMLIASIMKKNLETGSLFRVAVYSKVLMFVVATILDLLPFVSFSVPFLLRVGITMVFMGFAIAKLPDDRPVYTAPVMPQGGQNGQGWQ